MRSSRRPSSGCSSHSSCARSTRSDSPRWAQASNSRRSRAHSSGGRVGSIWEGGRERGPGPFTLPEESIAPEARSIQAGPLGDPSRGRVPSDGPRVFRVPPSPRMAACHPCGRFPSFPTVGGSPWSRCCVRGCWASPWRVRRTSPSPPSCRPSRWRSAVSTRSSSVWTCRGRSTRTTAGTRASRRAVCAARSCCSIPRSAFASWAGSRPRHLRREPGKEASPPR